MPCRPGRCRRWLHLAPVSAGCAISMRRRRDRRRESDAWLRSCAMAESVGVSACLRGGVCLAQGREGVRPAARLALGWRRGLDTNTRRRRRRACGFSRWGSCTWGWRKWRRRRRRAGFGAAVGGREAANVRGVATGPQRSSTLSATGAAVGRRSAATGAHEPQPASQQRRVQTVQRAAPTNAGARQRDAKAQHRA